MEPTKKWVSRKMSVGPRISKNTPCSCFFCEVIQNLKDTWGLRWTNSELSLRERHVNLSLFSSVNKETKTPRRAEGSPVESCLCSRRGYQRFGRCLSAVWFWMKGVEKPQHCASLFTGLLSKHTKGLFEKKKGLCSHWQALTHSAGNILFNVLVGGGGRGGLTNLPALKVICTFTTSGENILILQRPHTCINIHMCMDTHTQRGKGLQTQRYSHNLSTRYKIRQTTQ